MDKSRVGGMPVQVCFCRSNSKAVVQGGKLSVNTDTRVIENHSELLFGLNCAIGNIVGIKHDNEDCNLCTPASDREDDFADTEEFSKEQQFIAATLPANRQVICDLLTWMSVHQDWLRSSKVTRYFRANYSLIEAAIDTVNLLPQSAIDHRVTRMSQERFYDEVDFPNYCSWPYMPYPYKSRIYYVPTRIPTDLMVRDYLKTMLGLPMEFINAITNASETSDMGAISQRLNQSLGFITPTMSLEQRKRRDRVLGSWSTPTQQQQPRQNFNGKDTTTEGNELLKSTVLTPTGRELTGSPQSDPRERRAKRLDKRNDLRAIFNVTNPRLLLVSELGQINSLQMRPDYILKKHPNYINVFFIELPANAPQTYTDPNERW